MATRIISAHLTKKNTLKVKYKQQEVGKNGLEEVFDSELAKSSNQEIHRDLDVALHNLVPHLMFSTGLIDGSVAIPPTIKDEEYFQKFHWQDDKRFEGVSVTGVKTFGKHVVEGIYIYGQVENEHGDVTSFRSPLISLDISPENKYQLNHILNPQWATVETEIDKYIFELKNVKTITNQLSIFPPKEKVA